MQSLSHKLIKTTAMACVLALGATVTSQAGGPPTGAPGVLPPQSHPYGKSYAEWSGLSSKFNLELPLAGHPALDTNRLYGTTIYGGQSDSGTLFRVNTDGSGYTVMAQFASENGRYPSDLVQSGSALYGTTAEGGASKSRHCFQARSIHPFADPVRAESGRPEVE